MAPASLSRKLRVHTAQRLLVLNAPVGYLESLGELPEGAPVSQQPAGKHDFVHLFVTNSQELAELRQTTIDAVEHDGLLWISYPKRSSKVETDLTRDVLWKLMNDTGLRPVAQISVNDVWSAVRIRPAELVGR